MTHRALPVLSFRCFPSFFQEFYALETKSRKDKTRKMVSATANLEKAKKMLRNWPENSEKLRESSLNPHFRPFFALE